MASETSGMAGDPTSEEALAAAEHTGDTIVHPIPPPSPAAATPARELLEPRVLEPRWLIAAVVVGIAADVSLRHPLWINVAGASLLVIFGAALIGAGAAASHTSKALVGIGMFLSVFLVFRTETRLVVADICATLVLYFAAAVTSRGRSLWEFRPIQIASDLVVVLEGVLMLWIYAIEDVVRRFRRIQRRTSSEQGSGESAMLPIVRGLALAVPLLVVLGTLLASADAVFASFFSISVDPFPLFGHLGLIALGMMAVMVLIRVGVKGGGEPTETYDGQLGAIESAVVLGGINLLYLAFAVAQLMTVLGGADAALNRAGVEPKDFARQGFFQLLWVAGITLVVLTVVNLLTRRDAHALRYSRPFSLVAVGLTLLIVAVAFTRILFYIEADGHTPLRFYSAVFSLWIGVGFALVTARILGWQADRAWLSSALIGSGIAVLAVLNVFSPEAFIANQNMDVGYEHTFWHLRAQQFTDEGLAIIAERMDEIDNADLRAQLEQELCYVTSSRSSAEGRGSAHWLDYNVATARADKALAALCAN